MEQADMAVAVYRDDYNCAQAIFSVYSGKLGFDETLAKKIACGFGAGMGRTAGICGAVTGAFLVLGLTYGMSDSSRQEDKELTYEKVREFISRFEKRCSSINCADLLGVDISTPEGFREAREKDLMTVECEKIVAEAASILEELL